MLITFSCPAYADITLFGDIALRLLEKMGHSATVPGALLAEDVPAALAHLERAVRSEQPAAATQAAGNSEDDAPAVSLRHRALPLIALLKAAARDKTNVMWDSNT